MSFLWIPNVTNKLKFNQKKPSPKHKSSKKSLARDFIPLKNKKECLTKNSKNREPIKRISLLTFRTIIHTAVKIRGFSRKHKSNPRYLPGGMTVEAAFVLPLFLFFFLNLTTAIEIIRLSGNLDLAMWDVGQRLAVYAYAYDSLENRDSLENKDSQESDNKNKENYLTGILAGIVINSLWVRNEVIQITGEEYLNDSPVSGGAKGLFLGKSLFMEEDDCIELVVTYQVVPWTATVGFSGFRMQNRILARAWTGYEVQEREENIDYVYIAETGTVYHETKECSYIRLTIRTAELYQVEEMRNESGGRYEMCWLCKDAKNNGQVYITRTGTKYHNLHGCSGLKRTVYTIKRNEAGGYRKCSRC